MINHCRTLLLNMARNTSGTTVLGEEYIDPAFMPLELSGKLRAAQGVLIPAAASRADKNFYAYAIMLMLHAPDFNVYTTTFDARTVYDVSSSPYLSADIARTAYPQFSIGTLYAGLSAALMSPGSSIFDAARIYKADMDVFKDVWHGSPAYKDKVTAAVLATIYAIEEVRTRG